LAVIVRPRLPATGQIWGPLLAYLSLTQKVAPKMALTDTAIRSAKGQEKPYKLGDSGGLFLLVQPSGGKLWRLKYRIDGVEKKLSLGAYPGTIFGGGEGLLHWLECAMLPKCSLLGSD
jgi:hypothetical protein